jgi:lincosamide nucleotidyltransferase B/F
MMKRTEALLKRLDEIGQSLAKSGKGLALIGVGSVGAELDRLDQYSDLDFFAVVKPGNKEKFISDLDWLSAVNPIVYVFQNTVDGFKLLYEDGIFCEMAVFEPQELPNIPFAGSRIVWKDDSFDDALSVPRPIQHSPKTTEWLLGEALTNLYVGLGRFHRGEKLSAARFIQGYAVDRVVDLAGQIETEQPAHRDKFMAERRFEVRFPDVARSLPNFMQGYDHSPQSARTILEFLDTHFEVNPAIKRAILDLCEGYL